MAQATLIFLGMTLGAAIASVLLLLVTGYSPRQCETFTVGVATEKGAVMLGHIDLCGHDLQWGDVQQPVQGDNT